MNPGKLDRRITIQSRAITRDELGAAIGTYADWRTVSAAKEDRGGSESGLAESIRGQTTTVFKIRYLAGLTLAHRIVYAGAPFDIVSVQEIGRRQYQTVICRFVEAAAA